MAMRTFRKLEEIELLENCTDKDELRVRYLNRFGRSATPDAAVEQHIRIDSLWTSRKVLLGRLPVMRKAAATVMVPATIVHKGEQKQARTFTDDEIMVKIHNLLALQTQLQKETIVHLQGIEATGIAQMELFQCRLDATIEAKVQAILANHKCGCNDGKATS